MWIKIDYLLLSQNVIIFTYLPAGQIATTIVSFCNDELCRKIALIYNWEQDKKRYFFFVPKSLNDNVQ